MLDGAAAAGAKLVSFENLYLYGPTGGVPLTEDLPYEATGPKGRVRAQMASDLLASAFAKSRAGPAHVCGTGELERAGRRDSTPGQDKEGTSPSVL